MIIHRKILIFILFIIVNYSVFAFGGDDIESHSTGKGSTSVIYKGEGDVNIYQTIPDSDKQKLQIANHLEITDTETIGNQKIIRFQPPKVVHRANIINVGKEPVKIWLESFPKTCFFTLLSEKPIELQPREDTSFTIVFLNTKPSQSNYQFTVRDSSGSNIKVSINLEGDWKEHYKSMSEELSRGLKNPFPELFSPPSNKEVYEIAKEVVLNNYPEVEPELQEIIVAEFLTEVEYFSMKYVHSALLAYHKAERLGIPIYTLPNYALTERKRRYGNREDGIAQEIAYIELLIRKTQEENQQLRQDIVNYDKEIAVLQLKIMQGKLKQANLHAQFEKMQIRQNDVQKSLAKLKKELEIVQQLYNDYQSNEYNFTELQQWQQKISKLQHEKNELENNIDTLNTMDHDL